MGEQEPSCATTHRLPKPSATSQLCLHRQEVHPGTAGHASVCEATNAVPVSPPCSASTTLVIVACHGCCRPGESLHSCQHPPAALAPLPSPCRSRSGAYCTGKHAGSPAPQLQHRYMHSSTRPPDAAMKWGASKPWHANRHAGMAHQNAIHTAAGHHQYLGGWVQGSHAHSMPTTHTTAPELLASLLLAMDSCHSGRYQQHSALSTKGGRPPPPTASLSRRSHLWPTRPTNKARHQPPQQHAPC